MQSNVLSYISKDIAGLAPYAALEEPTWIWKLNETCQEQTIRNLGGVQTFSVLGIGIIVGVRSFIVGLSLVLDWLVGLVQRRTGWQKHKEMAWVLDGMLQQQRLAFEGDGYEKVWLKREGTVPVTLNGDEFPRAGVGH